MFKTVDDLVKELKELQEKGFGNKLIYDLDNQDYACTGVVVSGDSEITPFVPGTILMVFEMGEE